MYIDEDVDFFKDIETEEDEDKPDKNEVVVEEGDTETSELNSDLKQWIKYLD